jgi:ABC-2 type transport system ATP-binding protein
MQARIRRFVAEHNRRTGATILLTSHYMDDVVALCRRVLVIHHGRLLYDGGLADLATRMAPYKLVVVSFADGATPALDAYGEVLETEEGRTMLRVPRERAAERTAAIMRAFEHQVVDLSVEDPPIEEVIDRVFSGERVLTEAHP